MYKKNKFRIIYELVLNGYWMHASENRKERRREKNQQKNMIK